MLIKEKSYSQRKFHGAKYYQLYYRIILPSFDRLILVHLPPSHQKKNSIKLKEKKTIKFFEEPFKTSQSPPFFDVQKNFVLCGKRKKKSFKFNSNNSR